MFTNPKRGSQPIILHAAGKFSRGRFWRELTEIVPPALNMTPRSGRYEILTWNTRPEPCLAEICCGRLGLKPHVLGADRPDWKNIHKATTALAILDRLETHYVYGLDGFDVIIGADPDLGIDVFEKHFSGYQMVFNAAATCYPGADTCPPLRPATELEERDPHDNHYLNAGCWLARREFLRDFLTQVCVNYVQHHNVAAGRYAHSEQAWVKYTAWTDFPEQVALDYGNWIFAHMSTGKKELINPLIDVYIDLGANIGNSVMALRGDAKRAYAFEANPEVLGDPNWEPVRAAHPDLEIIPAAAWTANGQREFYVDTKSAHGEGSTLLKEKTTGRLDRTMNVECRDFADWLQHHVQPGQRCRIKIDIEGAEFEVLRRILELKLCDRITEIVIEWHGRKVGVPKGDERKITTALQREGVRVVKWK